MIQRKKAGFVKNALYLSHTTLNDFLNCPRAYYLKNIYRNPETGYKLQIASPYLSLGATVHDAIKWFLEQGSKLFFNDIEGQYRNHWQKYRGKKGGFSSDEEEAIFGKRGLKMLQNFVENSSKLEKLLPLINFPKYPLTENIILHGNMDFVGERKDDSLHVLDFKTGTRDEDSPIQLYIYAILAENNYEKPVSKASFWYLDRDENPKEIVIDSLEHTIDWLKEKGLLMQKAIAENNWVCKNGPAPDGAGLCRDCKEYQAIIDGKGEFMFSDYAFKKDIYFLSH
ncbi:MAG: PD-(D/E)XK nuclease family protein [Candidatus Daviesbacteria bacterium]|nr:PD-(D/E)XK nuclease family protein [Candidatus Daviesbacteria bacterium]